MAVVDNSAVIRTKIVATLGPANADAQSLGDLLEAGVDVCRLNFSHGTHEEHAMRLKLVRDWAAEHQQPIAVFGDLCGPKIRLSNVAGGSFELKTGDAVRFVRGEEECTPERLTISYPTLIDEVHEGERIYIDDGLVRLLVTAADGDGLTCTCTAGGTISSHKGVNLPDTDLSTPALTAKDRRDLDWAIDNDLDYVALSFVRSPRDLAELKASIEGRGSDLKVIVKVEKVEAVEHIDALVRQADAIMVARGDLGVETDVWRVPLIQKDIVARCRRAGKPVIVATQMLQSMVSSPMPTRAEVSDVANAILDGADAMMLSAETAVGHYPTGAVALMDHVARTTEAFQRDKCNVAVDGTIAEWPGATGAIVRAAVQAALHRNVRAVAAWTATGETVRLLARHRLPIPVIGLTYDERVYRRLNLFYGVVPLRVTPVDNPAEMGGLLDGLLVERGLAAVGDAIVVVTSTRPRTPGGTDTVLMHEVSEG